MTTKRKHPVAVAWATDDGDGNGWIHDYEQSARDKFDELREEGDADARMYALVEHDPDAEAELKRLRRVLNAARKHVKRFETDPTRRWEDWQLSLAVEQATKEKR